MRHFRAFAGALAVLALAACAQIGDLRSPQVHVVDIRLLQSGLLEQRFRVDLRIGNPNDFDLPLDGLTFELDLNGRHFAEGFTDQAVTVPRLGQARISVDASTSLFDMMEQILILGERAELSYRIEGVAYLRGSTRRHVPYERGGRLRLLPERPGERTLVPL
ncbi:MAG: LEA type 2 family protein [Alphaproteobacteria bacterium]